MSATKRIVVGISGASGVPLAVQCLLELRRHPEWMIHLIISRGAMETIRWECTQSLEEIRALAHVVYDVDAIGAAPASGSFETEGMLIVPCSMKTVAGICLGYTDNLLLRAADVTIKEHRRLVLVPRESPLSPIHLRSLYELSKLPQVIVAPPVLTFYNKPESIGDMIAYQAARSLSFFGIECADMKRWMGHEV